MSIYRSFFDKELWCLISFNSMLSFCLFLSFVLFSFFNNSYSSFLILFFSLFDNKFPNLVTNCLISPIFAFVSLSSILVSRSEVILEM